MLKDNKKYKNMEEVIRIKKNDIEKSRKYRCCYAK